jgi:hypothetical protein
VKDGVAYPGILLTGGINDPRVDPSQPAKMAARLQAATSSKKPMLLRVDYDAGHGMGSTRAPHDLEFADEMSFLLWQVGDPEFQPLTRFRDSMDRLHQGATKADRSLPTLPALPSLFTQTGSDRYREQGGPMHGTWQRSGLCDERHASGHDAGQAPEYGRRRPRRRNEAPHPR